MRTDATPYGSEDFERAVTVTLWPKSVTYAQVLGGTATGGTDLSADVTSVRQGEAECSIRLAAWPSSCSAQAKPGQIISIDADGNRLWNGVIDSVNDYREERGARSLQIVSRTRDGVGLWRDNRFVSGIYPSGTALERIAVDIARAMGLTSTEHKFPATGFWVPHTNAQMADMSPWDMLETVFLAAGLSPFADVLGRIRTYRRDVTRRADIVLDDSRVLAITGARARPAVNNVKLRWLDRNLSKVTQQDQVLATDSVTAGFFKLEQEREEWFSNDRRQRAQSTRMVVKQSVNSGLLPVGDEEYTVFDQFHGRLKVTTYFWVPALATASIAALLAAHAQPDLGDGSSLVPSPTIPIGRIVEGAATAAILLVMMSLGTGHYEFWGEPYDYVHARNTTEAFDRTAPAHLNLEKEIENDFITDQPHAREVAARELLHAIASSSSWGARIVDDPRVEQGDILELPDRSRLCVMGYSRDLTRGAPAVLDLTGFRC